jgi:hypothetical protein
MPRLGLIIVSCRISYRSSGNEAVAAINAPSRVNHLIVSHIVSYRSSGNEAVAPINAPSRVNHRIVSHIVSYRSSGNEVVAQINVLSRVNHRIVRHIVSYRIAPVCTQLQFLCSQVHIPAGWRLQARPFTWDSTTPVLYSSGDLLCPFINPRHGPKGEYSLYC